MNPVALLAKDYASRQVLDDYVRNELGDGIQANRIAGHTISGTAAELKAISLSTASRVFGVRVILLADSQ